MFEGNERLMICNKRYIEIYRLSAEVSKPGTAITRMLDFRAANGSFMRDPEIYRRELVAAMVQGQTTTAEVKSPDGRTISVINRPMGGGGWVGTHEDITDRRDAERERGEMHEHQQQRNMIDQAIAAFRQRGGGLGRSFGELGNRCGRDRRIDWIDQRDWPPVDPYH